MNAALYKKLGHWVPNSKKHCTLQLWLVN